jgi:polyisoprenoid-binding protein YceI
MKPAQILILALLLLSATINAQKYIPAENGSRIEFSVKSGKGTDATLIKGLLGGLNGTMYFDAAHPEKTTFDVSVSTLSIRTSSGLATEKINMPEYLNTRAFPTIRIKSTSVTNNGGPVYEMIGMLTIKGISKAVKIQFTVQNSGSTPSFRGLLQFNRSLYKIGTSGEMEDVISVYLNIKTKKA